MILGRPITPRPKIPILPKITDPDFLRITIWLGIPFQCIATGWAVVDFRGNHRSRASRGDGMEREKTLPKKHLWRDGIPMVTSGALGPVDIPATVGFSLSWDEDMDIYIHTTTTTNRLDICNQNKSRLMKTADLRMAVEARSSPETTGFRSHFGTQSKFDYD